MKQNGKFYYGFDSKNLLKVIDDCVFLRHPCTHSMIAKTTTVASVCRVSKIFIVTTTTSPSSMVSSSGIFRLPVVNIFISVFVGTHCEVYYHEVTTNKKYLKSFNFPINLFPYILFLSK